MDILPARIQGSIGSIGTGVSSVSTNITNRLSNLFSSGTLSRLVEFLSNPSQTNLKLLFAAAVGCIVIYYLVVTYVYPLYYHRGINASKKSDPDSYRNAVQSLESSLGSSVNLLSPEEKTFTLIQLARLYHSGIPEKTVYDNFTETQIVVDGVNPNISKSIEYYLKAYSNDDGNNGENRSQLAGLELANIYHYESETGFQDLKKAEKIYREILEYSSTVPIDSIAVDPFVDSEARSQLLMLQTRQTEPNGIAENTTAIGATTAETFQTVDNNVPIDNLDFTLLGGGFENGVGVGFQAPPAPRPPRPVMRRRVPQVLNEEGNVVLDTPIVNPELDIITGQMRNDPQNSHDHSVIQSVQQSIQNLTRHTDIEIDIPTCFSQIRGACSNHARGNDALRVLDTIEKSTLIQGHAGMKESELLQLVWNRIGMLPADQRDTLVGNLVNELSEGVEHGLVMCGTGRTNRIVDSLNMVDPLVTIKPKWALNQEMMGKAGQIRAELIERLSEEKHAALECPNPTPAQEELNDQFDNLFKETLQSQFKRDYVDTGLMQQTILDNELGKWI